MRENFTQLYLHCVWAAWDRLPLITAAIQQDIYAVIIHECQQLKCTVIAIGGVDDHIHLLVGSPPALSISELIKQIKGSSSHCVNHKIAPGKFFKWQGAYAVFTVNHDSLIPLCNYIQNQAIHHSQQSIISHWELP